MSDMPHHMQQNATYAPATKAFMHACVRALHLPGPFLPPPHLPPLPLPLPPPPHSYHAARPWNPALSSAAGPLQYAALVDPTTAAQKIKQQTADLILNQ